MNSLVCQAIRERRILRLSYDGGLRDVEPHCHGCSRDDNDLLRAYQIGGVSRSGDSSGGRCFGSIACPACPSRIAISRGQDPTTTHRMTAWRRSTAVYEEALYGGEKSSRVSFLRIPNKSRNSGWRREWDSYVRFFHCLLRRDDTRHDTPRYITTCVLLARRERRPLA
jgi:hypothetical protein